MGEGSELDRCKVYAVRNNLHQIVFHGYKSGAELDACYRMADVMLISLIDDPIISLTLPLKMQSYMAAGKPIIASADGEIAAVIEEASCGYAVPAGDSEKLAEAVIRMKCDPDFTVYGENARKYYDCHFPEERFITVLEETLKTYGDSSRTMEEADEGTDNQFSVRTR